jgi:nitroreductase
MDALTAVMSRRSIRTYTGEAVSDAQIETILRAAMAAPSAGNQQSWRFVVVTDDGVKAELAQATPYARSVGLSAVTLVVCGDTRAEKHPGYWVQDCSAAIENALVAVHALGLGAVWIGVHPIEERVEAVARVVATPEGVRPLAMLAIGHPAESKEPSERYEPAYVHRDHWRD